jgi:DNA-directed RNA polymerase specialized sigma24 family protein
MADGRGGFEAFVEEARPRLARAFGGCRGDDAPDAVAEALAYAWEHWEEIAAMDNPLGYLFRVGQSRTRLRRRARGLPPPADVGVPEVEPALVPALLALPERQRTAVWLVHACEWRYAEVAEALGTSVSMVGNHVSRGVAALRKALEVQVDA